MCYEPRTELECLRTMYDDVMRDLVTLRDAVTDPSEFEDREQIAAHLDTLISNYEDEHSQPVCSVCGWTRKDEGDETYCRWDTPHSYPGWLNDCQGRPYASLPYTLNAAVKRERLELVACSEGVPV